MHVVVGDDLQESALKDDETLCMDKVYNALDWYKKAAMETREIEVHLNILCRPTVLFLATYHCLCSCKF